MLEEKQPAVRLCFECEEVINIKRIKAMPSCTLCIKCQENNDVPFPKATCYGYESQGESIQKAYKSPNSTSIWFTNQALQKHINES